MYDIETAALKFHNRLKLPVSDLFAGKTHEENGYPFMSFSSLSKLMDKKGNPRAFMEYYMRTPEENKAHNERHRAMIEYLIKGEAYVKVKYDIIEHGLNTNAGKEARDNAIKNGRPWIKRADLDCFPLMQRALILEPKFVEFVEDADTQFFQYDTVLAEGSYGVGSYPIKRYRHMVAPNGNVGIIRIGSFNLASSYLLKDNLIDMQAAIYTYGTNAKVFVFFIDTNGHTATVEVSEESLRKGMDTLKAALNKVSAIQDNNQWHLSHSFNYEGGICKM